MKLAVAILLLLTVLEVDAQSQCLQAVASASKLCFNMQVTGQKLADDIQLLDTLVQSTIYQSIEEGSKMLASAMQLLMKDIANIRVSATGTAPIEQSQMNTTKAAIQNVAKESVTTANKEIQSKMIIAIKQLINDDVFVNKVVTTLGLSSSSGRKRRSVKVSKSDQSLGNSIDGIVDKLLPSINTTLRNADLKMISAFQQAFNTFTSSIKQLVGAKILINLDEAKSNMELMITQAAKILIDAKVEQARVKFTRAVKHLQQIIDLVSDYKSDNTKLVKLLEPAKIIVSEEINRSLSRKNESGLQARVDAAVLKMKEYYKQIKKIVTG